MPVINPSYSGGRDQEDLEGSLGNSSMRPYLEKSVTKIRTGGVAQGEGPEFKPQYCKKKKVDLNHLNFCILSIHSPTHPGPLGYICSLSTQCINLNFPFIDFS
jgi:hypothetical protein